MEKGGGNNVVGGAVAPCPPAPCLGNWGNADLRCHCPEPCTGLHWILQNRMFCKNIFRYVIVLYGNPFVISLLHFSAGPISRQEESVWFTIYGAWWRIGANCVSRSPMYINRIRICGATLTLPAPAAAGWSKFFKQTLIHFIQTEGTTTPWFQQRAISGWVNPETSPL